MHTAYKPGKKKKSIVIVSGVYPPEPYVSARMSEAIALELAKTEQVKVLCPEVSRPVGNVKPRVINCTENYQVVTLPSYTCPESKVAGRLKESYSIGKETARYIRENKDSIGVIYANTHPTFGQYLLIDEARKHGIPVIIHIQDIYPESLTKKLGAIGKIIEPALTGYDGKKIKHAAKILTISNQMKQALIKSRGYSAEQVEVIYNWQDENLFNTDFPRQNSKFTFMFSGSINPTASVKTVIKAFGMSGLNDCRLVIAGDGSDKENCKTLAAGYPEADIEFVSISPQTVAQVQSQADVLILPLRRGISATALPSKLPAYMFSARPIIACVEGDSEIAHIIRTSEAGWIIDPENPEQLSEKMKDCKLLSADMLRSKGLKGRKYALENFSQNSNLSRVCSLIKKYI